MVVGIIGTRTFTDYKLFSSYCDQELDKILTRPGVKLTDIVIASGGAPGTDAMAERYARVREYDTLIRRAKWGLYNKQAGPIRNTRLMKDCHTVIAFWDGKSKGTGNAISLAQAMKKPVTVINYV